MLYVFIISVIFLIGYYLFESTSSSRPNSYYRARKILTDNEIEFYHRIIKAVPEFIVLTQVPVGQMMVPVVDPKKDKKTYNSLRFKMSYKISDFIICDSNFNVIVIIELDDKMHDKKKDELRDALLKDAGYSTIRYQSKQKPLPATIRSDILKYTDGTELLT